MKDNWKAKMKYWWTVLYCPLYLLCFMLVEKRDVPVTIVSIALDHKIPFLEVFIIPYLFWFPYIAGMFLIFFFKDKEEFLRMIKYLYMGMTLFIIISFLYPNGLDIRPAYFERDNILVRLVQMIYQNDTSTNVVPSIHVYNSIVVMIAALRSEKVLPKKMAEGSLLHHIRTDHFINCFYQTALGSGCFCRNYIGMDRLSVVL